MEYASAQEMRQNYCRIRSGFFRFRPPPVPVPLAPSPVPVLLPAKPLPSPRAIPLIDWMIGTVRKPIPTFAETEAAVCAVLGTTVEILRWPTRRLIIVRQRQFAHFVAYTIAFKSLKFIGLRYRMDHTSVIKSISVMRVLIATDPDWGAHLREVRRYLRMPSEPML